MSGAADPAPAGARLLPRSPVAARDGVELCTDVFLPPLALPRPTVLLRTPYGRSQPFVLYLARRLSDAGLCVATQDCRGRYGSGGLFELDREEKDTLDTLAWLGRQSWHAGPVGMVGISISAYPSYRAAAAEPPPGVEVKALASVVGALDCHSIFFRDGALLLHWALPWVTLMSPVHQGRSTWLRLPWRELFDRLPVAESARATGGHRQLFEQVLAFPAYSDRWRQLSALERLSEVRAPSLLVCGWYDFLLRHTLRAFQVLARREAPAPVTAIVGRWNHHTVFQSFLGGEANGREGAGQLDLLGLLADWMRGHLLGGSAGAAAPLGTAGGSRALLYVLGEEAWIAAPALPLAESRPLALYLDSDGRANGAAGDGRLVAQPPVRCGQDTFVYDPASPVPTAGGAVWPFPPCRLFPGPADQSEVEARADVLVYSSDPLPRELLVVGPVEVELWAASTARDTDFTAKLVDVDPAGTPRILQDGILRTRFRESLAREAPWEPNRPHRLRLDLEAIAYRFAPGHRLRLEVASSNFPKFDRHLNTAGPLYTGTGSMVANQTVFHGEAMPSRLLLQVLEREAFERLRWQPDGRLGGRDQASPPGLGLVATGAATGRLGP